MRGLGMSVALFALCVLLISPVVAENIVYLIPQQSNATYCNTTAVEIWVNATNFVGGEINLTYDSGCANVTNWARNTTNFDNGFPKYFNGRIFIDFYDSRGLKTGNYMIGTLTIHCVNNSLYGCETPLTFDESSVLRNITSIIQSTWKNGTFTCGELQQCLGTCCDDPSCDVTFARNMTCATCSALNKYWKPNKDSACFNETTPSDLCLSYCPQCCNGIDDDDPDDDIDFPADSECTCGLDPSEANPAAPVPELPTIALFSLGLLVLTGYMLRKRA